MSADFFSFTTFLSSTHQKKIEADQKRAERILWTRTVFNSFFSSSRSFFNTKMNLLAIFMDFNVSIH